MQHTNTACDKQAAWLLVPQYHSTAAAEMLNSRIGSAVASHRSAAPSDAAQCCSGRLPCAVRSDCLHVLHSLSDPTCGAASRVVAFGTDLVASCIACSCAVHNVATNRPVQWQRSAAQRCRLLDWARSICCERYERMPAGLAPEIAHFVTNAGPSFAEHLHMGDMVVKANDAHHLQRPETVESLFVLYRLTKNETYREWGWKIFERWQAHCKVSSGGYASLDSVLTTAPRQRDKMESFFLAETLKYLFLLFSDDPSLVPLDRYVLSCCHLSNPARHAARCTGRHASAMPACMGHCHTVMGSINLRL